MSKKWSAYQKIWLAGTCVNVGGLADELNGGQGADEAAFDQGVETEVKVLDSFGLTETGGLGENQIRKRFNKLEDARKEWNLKEAESLKSRELSALMAGLSSIKLTP